MTDFDFDVTVIGAGPGGYVAAIRAAQMGLNVALVEKDTLGGVCLNRGCIPSKALIHAAHVLEQMQSASKMGLHVKDIQINPIEMQSWKQGVVDRLVKGIGSLLKHHKVTVIQGTAQFAAPHKIEVTHENNTTPHTSANFILATGSRPIQIPGLEGEHVLSSTEALSLQDIPESFAIVGGGYIGLEIGSFYAKMGSQVTVVEMMDSLLPLMDQDLVKVVARKLKKKKVKVELKAKALSHGQGQLKVDTPKGEKMIPAQKVLVAVGRLPNTHQLGLEKLGLEPQTNGRLATDLQMRSSLPHIYAIGDIVDGPMLAHKASREGIIAAEAIAGRPTVKDHKVIPAVCFTDPEIATVGLSEAEAKESGHEVKVSKFPFSALGKAVASNAPEGFVKLVTQADTGVLLGAHMVGAEVSNLISEAALAIEMGAVAQDLALTIHPHPTLSEALMEAGEAIYGHAIHSL